MELKLLIIGIVLFALSRVMRIWKDKLQRPVARKLYNEAYEWIETGWSAVLLAAFLMYFFIQAFKIPSGSMRDTLLEGDHLFVNKASYGFHIPFSGGKRFWPLRQVQRGDIIIFECPPAGLSAGERAQKMKKDFIKRCLAVSGDMVQIKDKKLFVNGKPVVEPYTQFADDSTYPAVQLFSTSEEYQRAWEEGKLANLPPDVIRDNFGPVIIPTGTYFAIGDNRDRSFDSRFWGPVPDHLLKGRALLIYWPFSRVRLIR